MSQFFIEFESESGVVEYYELSVTTDVIINYAGNPTQHPVEDGTVITDQIQNQNVSLSFQGLITDIKNVTLGPIITRPQGQNQQLVTQAQRSVADNLEGLVRIRNSRSLVTVYYDFRQPPLENCAFTSLNFERDAGTGTSYRASISFQQVQLSERAKLVTQPTPQPEVEDQVEGKTNSSSNSTEEVEVKELQETLLLSSFGTIVNQFAGGTNDN